MTENICPEVGGAPDVEAALESTSIEKECKALYIFFVKFLHPDLLSTI